MGWMKRKNTPEGDEGAKSVQPTLLTTAEAGEFLQGFARQQLHWDRSIKLTVGTAVPNLVGNMERTVTLRGKNGRVAYVHVTDEVYYRWFSGHGDPTPVLMNLKRQFDEWGDLGQVNFEPPINLSV